MKLHLFSTLIVSIFLWSFHQNIARAQSHEGKDLFKLCTYCHGMNGEGNQKVAAPSIAGLPEWYVRRQLDKFHNAVRGGNSKDLGGLRMRPMAKTLDPQTDFEAVAKYVSSMPRPKLPNTVVGRPFKGEQSYQPCAACHGDKGQGNEVLNAPPLAGASDWYLETQLHNFKAMIRGGDPSKDPTGSQMVPMASMLDDEGMKNVVSYINSFK